MPAYNRDHYAFCDKFALAVIRTATNPDAPVRDITGSYTALRTALKSLGGGVHILDNMTKPGNSELGFDHISLDGDTWTFTSRGAGEYPVNLAWARRYSAQFKAAR